MTANYVLLEKITVGAAGAASVTFSGIPQTGYTDLVVKVNARNASTSGSEYFQLSFNGVTTNLNDIQLLGYTTAVSSYTDSTVVANWVNGSGTTANTFSNVDVYIPNYTSSNYKSISIDGVTENNSGATNAAYAALTAGLWSSTAAITSMTLTSKTGTFAQYSTFYLYGVAKLGTTPAIVPYATGGDTIMTDGTYWYHAFRSSGTFTPAKGLSCDYLVVAGGGAGYNGGGGAGGLRSTVTATGGGGSLETAKSFASGTAYTITIGAGGASYGTSGSNSSIAGTGLTTITSIGGGGGGSPAQVGGSGGGGGDGNSGAAGTANQGYAGGNTSGVGVYAGGGGAGAVGSNGPAGAGGAGVAISAFASSTGTGVSNYYAGGGGGAASTAPGGAGGAGGGGGGEGGTTGRSAGVANTGGGGGGAYNGVGGPSLSYGGSGLVIVRYAV